MPVLAIAAHIPRSEIGSEYFQETHPQDLFRECSVYCELVSTPEMAPRILEMAMRAAVEENGVAVVVIPGEIFLANGRRLRLARQADPCRPDRWCAPTTSRCAGPPTSSTPPSASRSSAAPASQGAHDALVRLAGTLNAPIVHALRGKEFIEYDNPFDVGMTGLLGFASGYKAIKEADALLMLGTDFPYQQFYPDNAQRHPGRHPRPQPRPAHADRPRPGRRRSPTRWPRCSRCCARSTSRAHLDRSLRHYRKTRKSLDALAVNDRDKTPIRPEYVAGLANRLAADDAVFTVDVGSPVVWAARYLTMNGTAQAGRLVQPRHHGVRAAARDRRADRVSRTARWSRWPATAV